MRDGFADGRSRAERLTDRFRAVYHDGQAEGFDWIIEPDGTWEVTETLEVFAWSENGDALLWDVSARTPGGEFPVWLSTGLNSLVLLGRDLYAALEQLGASESVADEASAGSVTPLPAFQI